MYDPHPLDFLRTNVTVQQFDELIETYGDLFSCQIGLFLS